MGARGVLEDIALVAQLTGLHAIMLIALAARLLRIPQCEAECAKLEGCARKLRALLLQWPEPAGGDDAATGDGSRGAAGRSGRPRGLVPPEHALVPRSDRQEHGRAAPGHAG
jgi:hypothetical protein